MNKTINDWLSELPEPYRARALANMNAFDSENALEDSLAGSIKTAFYWTSSPEGWDFWNKVYLWALVPQELPPIPSE